jgi:hypothetical protein
LLIKQVQFLTKTASGSFFHPLFGSYGEFEKTAGAPAFADWSTGDEIRDFVSKLDAANRARYLYVLVNALGAGENYGSNINADYFPWDALKHEGQEYGYQTFLNANAFQHHVNKDPEKGFGKVQKAILNHPMHRVELIIALDREKAKAVNAQGVLERIERGEFPDVSMGCKVPYDVCMIRECGNKSRTKDDYCKHMRPPDELRHLYGPNKILADGQKCCVSNTLPRFFDLSFVFIGADKTAKTMAKLAEKQGRVCLGDVCAVPSQPITPVTMVQVPESYHVEKTAAAKEECICENGCCDDKLAVSFGQKTAAEKISEIVKEIPVSQKRVYSLSKSEPTVGSDKLNELAKHPMGVAAGSLGGLGIVLKPSEFQTLILIKMGEVDFANELSAKNQVFRPVEKIDSSIKLAFDASVAHSMVDLFEERSAFAGPLTRRMIKLGEKTLPTPSAIQHPLLDEISAAYNGYRLNLLTKFSQATEAIESDPQLRDALFGRNLVDMFSKTASLPLITPDSVAYLAGAHYDRSLLSNTDVAIQVTSDPWLKSHLSAQGF